MDGSKLLWAVVMAAAPALCLLGTAPASAKSPPLRNPALLNIGFVCRWDGRCMKRQEQAMGRALKYVRKKNPPAWKVQLCNRNAGRNGTRVDWIGYNNCIRNEALRPPVRKRRR